MSATPSLRIFRNEKPHRSSGGVQPNHGQITEGTYTMQANPLFSKQTSPPTVKVSRAVSAGQQLQEWLDRAETEVFSTTVLITPQLARAILDRNPDNRPVLLKGSNRSVSAYASAMRRGEWSFNGETIIISSDGYLNDGQHRMLAVEESGVSVMMLLVFGVQRDTRHTVDQGIARTNGHVLAIAGEKNANVLAPALQFLWALDNGATFHARPSPDQLLETLAAHPDIREAITGTLKLCGQFRLSTGYSAGAHYVCRKHNLFLADQWLAALTTGLNIQNVNSPVSRLRKMYAEHSAKRQRKPNIDQAALYIKGFNLFRSGRTGAFTWRANGPAAEAFPTAQG